jgi:outer membrane murein-binding lipoprotein Lpp
VNGGEGTSGAGRRGGPDRLTRLAAMPGTTRLPALLALVAAVAALSGCGSDDEIGGQVPPANADQLTAALNAVRSDVEAGQCDAAASEARAFVEAVNGLPVTATAELKDALRDAGGNLQQLVSEECPATGATGPTGEQTTTADTTSSTTTSSSTTTTSSSTTETQPENGNQGDENGGGGSGGGGHPGGGGGAGGGGSGGGSDGGTGGTGGTGG